MNIQDAIKAVLKKIDHGERMTWVGRLSNDDLKDLYRQMTLRRMDADFSSYVEMTYQTTQKDYEDFYDCVKFVMHSRGMEL